VTKPIKDLSASVRQRLQNVAKADGRPFQEVLEYFAMERFLYRLSASPHAPRFTLKGALMFLAWHAPSTRPTRDIDLLGQMNHGVEVVVPVFREVCGQAVEPDGLSFDAESVVGEVINEDADYTGVRLTFLGWLQNARVSMQVDLGFGDVVTPAATMTEYPTILDFPAPRLLGYPKETAIAEKFEAMVKLGVLNSRMKDFYDIWSLSRQFEFEGASLLLAVKETFANRETKLPKEPTALTDQFTNTPGKQAQWAGFLRKSRLTNAPKALEQVIADLRPFLLPIAEAAGVGSDFSRHWTPSGPWR